MGPPDLDLRTKTGWDKAKNSAKSRQTLFSLFSPPWSSLRLHRINEAKYGEDHKWTKAVERSAVFLEELRLVLRCLAICGIKHAIGEGTSLR